MMQGLPPPGPPAQNLRCKYLRIRGATPKNPLEALNELKDDFFF